MLWKLRVEPDQALWLPCPSLSFSSVLLNSLFVWRNQEGQGRCASATHLALGKGQRKLQEEGDTYSWRFWNNFTRTEKGAHGLCGKALTCIQMEMFEGSQQFPLDLPTESEDLLSVFCYVLVLFLSFCSLLRNFFLLYAPLHPLILLRFAVFLF